MPDGIIRFRKRQLPDDLLSVGTVSGPTAWRFDKSFVESPDGSRRLFTLDEAFVADKILVFQNGSKLVKTQEYIAHPPNVVEFVTAPVASPTQYLEAWFLVPTSGEETQWVVDETPSGSKNSVNRTFTTYYPYASGKLNVYRNGVKLIKGAGYNWIELTSRTFQVNVAPTSTDFIEVTYMIQV